MAKERFDYLDIARGLGILMVVWAHILLTGWTHRMIYAFHMPLFFLLSGMVFKREKYHSFGDFFVHRAKRLLVPYVIYSVVTWAFWAMFRYVRHDAVDSYVMPLLQTFIAQGSGAFFAHNSALWFIPCLFLTEILYFFICRLGRWWSLVICFACAALSFTLGHIFGNDYWFVLPWNADAALIALPFYAVGNLSLERVGHKRLMAFVAEHKAVHAVTWVGMTLLLFWIAMPFGECSMGSSSYQCVAWVFIPRAFLGCAWLVLLSLLLSQVQRLNWFIDIPTRYLKWAGKKSRDIMCIHIPVKGISMIAVAAVLHITVGQIENNMLYSLVAFIITMVAAWMVIRLVRGASPNPS